MFHVCSVLVVISANKRHTFGFNGHLYQGLVYLEVVIRLLLGGFETDYLLLLIVSTTPNLVSVPAIEILLYLILNATGEITLSMDATYLGTPVCPKGRS